MNSTTMPAPWICQVEVSNFRRFTRAKITLQPGITCLIGQGDVGKSTLLAAIEFALWPSYPLTITDNDFHRADMEDDLVITVSIVNPPSHLRTDAKFLTHLMGFRDGQLVDDPTEHGTEPTALQVELRVDSTLEPTWNVIKPGLEPRPISKMDRASLGVARIGTDADRHLRWGRGSSLYRLTETTSTARSVVVEAGRAAREASSQPVRESLQAVTRAIETAARRIRGIWRNEALVAALDSDSFTRNLSQVALHGQDSVPLSRAGEGSKRLVAIASQLVSAAQPGILLVDEIEHGLEPVRVQAMIRMLLDECNTGTITQAVLTTHSPRAIRELEVSQLKLARLGPSDIGEMKSINADLQGLVRWSPDSLLSPRVVVCEGATEVGLVRGLIADMQRREQPIYVVAEAADAAGSANVVRYANMLAALGYEVAAMYDLDKEPKDLKDLNTTITSIRPEEGNATEHQFFANLTDRGVKLAVRLAQELGTADRETLNSKLRSRDFSQSVIDSLLSDPASEVSPALRRALASIAHKDDWFKRIAYAELLLLTVKQEIAVGSHLATMLNKLEAWLGQIRD